MHLAALEQRQLAERQGGSGAFSSGNTQRHQHLVGVQTRVVVAQEIKFQLLYRANDFGAESVWRA